MKVTQRRLYNVCIASPFTSVQWKCLVSKWRWCGSLYLLKYIFICCWPQSNQVSLWGIFQSDDVSWLRGGHYAMTRLLVNAHTVQWFL